MAHFAELDENNVVLQVLVVDNKDITDENGQEQESLGVQFLEKLFGHSRWKQTSYNSNFRKRLAPVGGKYDSENDVFLSIKPYPSWVLDEEFEWKAPIDRPEDYLTGDPPKQYWWKEESQEWKYMPRPPEDAGTEGKFYFFNEDTEEWELQ